MSWSIYSTSVQKLSACILPQCSSIPIKVKSTSKTLPYCAMLFEFLFSALLHFSILYLFLLICFVFYLLTFSFALHPPLCHALGLTKFPSGLYLQKIQKTNNFRSEIEALDYQIKFASYGL